MGGDRRLKGPREDGNVMLEFALALPIIMVLATGIINLGWGIKQKTSVTNAVLFGLRTAAKADPRVAGSANVTCEKVADAAKKVTEINLSHNTNTTHVSVQAVVEKEPDLDYCRITIRTQGQIPSIFRVFPATDLGYQAFFPLNERICDEDPDC